MRGVSHLGAGCPHRSGPYSSALVAETVANASATRLRSIAPREEHSACRLFVFVAHRETRSAGRSGGGVRRSPFLWLPVRRVPRPIVRDRCPYPPAPHVSPFASRLGCGEFASA